MANNEEKHGHWIVHTDDPDAKAFVKDGESEECSVCHSRGVVYGPDRIKYGLARYCQKCGAVMDGEVEVVNGK